MIRMMKNSDIEDELLEIFKVFDRDGNGQVSPAELRYVMKNNIADKISDARVSSMFKKADPDDLLEKADTDGDG